MDAIISFFMLNKTCKLSCLTINSVKDESHERRLKEWGTKNWKFCFSLNIIFVIQ